MLDSPLHAYAPPVSQLAPAVPPQLEELVSRLFGERPQGSLFSPGRLAFCQSAPLSAGRVECLHADETLLFRLTYVCNFKRTRHEVWDRFETKVGFIIALFNILVQ